MVVIEYFTKWIEAEPLEQITAHKVQHFVWKNIMCRFGIPRHLVSNNGTQFASQQLGKLCSELGIKQIFCLSRASSDEWSGGVGQHGLAKRLEKAARESKGYMVRGDSSDFVGLPDHYSINDQ